MGHFSVSFHRLLSKHITFACISCVAAQGLISSLIAEESPGYLQEAILLRRISEFWKDQDYLSAKTQIRSFLNKYKDSTATDSLLAMLGDLYFQEENYREAADLYAQIKSSQIMDKIMVRRLHALYVNKEYATLSPLAKSYLEQSRTSNLQERLLLAQSELQLALLAEDPSEKRTHAECAKQAFLILHQTELSGSILHPLAESYRLLGQYEQASSLFLQLAKLNVKKEEDFLLLAAQSQLLFNKQEAACTFGQIAELKGPRASHGAYNQFALLYQLELYHDLVAIPKTVLDLIPSNSKMQIDFYLGWAHHVIGNHEQAIAAFEKYLAGRPLDLDQIKRALTAIVISSSRCQNGESFERALVEFQKYFPEADERSQALILHAQFSLDKKDKETAHRDIDTLLRQFPNIAERQALLYDYALLITQEGLFERARELWSDYVEEFREGPHTLLAWKHLLNSNIQLFKSNSLSKENFAKDLKSAIAINGLLSNEEERQLRFQLIRLYFELQQQDELQNAATDYFTHYADHVSCADIHLRLALMHDSNSLSFCKHAEEALKINKELPHSSLIHLQLYNSYLHLTSADASYFKDAADHLYQVFLRQDQPLKDENLLWAAHYYTEAGIRENAVAIYENLLGVSKSTCTLPISKGSSMIESTALKLTVLYDLQGQYEEELRLLDAVNKLQENSPDLDWKLRRQIVYSSAVTSEKLGQYDKALNQYDYLIFSSTHLPSYLSEAAMLQRARLLYRTLPAAQRTKSDPQLLAILENLKDLQIQKRLSTEPLHLEAAIEYIGIRLDLISPEEKIEQALFFWKRMKDDFTNAYAGHLNQSNEVISTYLAFADAEIAYFNSLQAEKNGMKEGSRLSQVQATQILQQLSSSQTLTPFLKEQIKSRLEHRK